jgi:hypothetical protein
VAEQGDQEGAAALKEIFNARRIRYIAAEVVAVYPAFDSERFVRANLRGLETLSLIKRMQRVAETLHAAICVVHPGGVSDGAIRFRKLHRYDRRERPSELV